MPDIVSQVKTIIPETVASASTALEHDKPDPAVADAGQVNGQEALAGRERQKREQAENDGPVRFDHAHLARVRACYRCRLNRGRMLMFLEADLVMVSMIAMGKADARRELVRLGNFFERFKIAATISEGECLPAAIGP